MCSTVIINATFICNRARTFELFLSIMTAYVRGSDVIIFFISHFTCVNIINRFTIYMYKSMRKRQPLISLIFYYLLIKILLKPKSIKTSNGVEIKNFKNDRVVELLN